MTKFRSERVAGAAGAALLAAVLMMSVAAQAVPATGARIALMACPRQGALPSCLMINGSDGTVYNITSATPRPPLDGRMIRLRATVTNKLSACLQGTVLDSIRWTPVRQKCAN